MALPSKSLQGNWTHGIGKSALLKEKTPTALCTKGSIRGKRKKRSEYD